MEGITLHNKEKIYSLTKDWSNYCTKKPSFIKYWYRSLISNKFYGGDTTADIFRRLIVNDVFIQLPGLRAIRTRAVRVIWPFTYPPLCAFSVTVQNGTYTRTREYTYSIYLSTHRQAQFISSNRRKLKSIIDSPVSQRDPSRSVLLLSSSLVSRVSRDRSADEIPPK